MEISTHEWAKLVGIKPVRIRYDLPIRAGGPLNAGYAAAKPSANWPATIGLTPLLAAGTDRDVKEAIIAHEFGHAIQDAYDPHFANGLGTLAQEDGADAISGILLQSETKAQKAYVRLQDLLAIFGIQEHRTPTDHSPDHERVVRISNWANWAKGKTDAERRAKIIALAKGEVAP